MVAYGENCYIDDVKLKVDDSEEIDKLTREGVKAAPESVTGTPSFLIKGEKLEAESFEALAAAIDAELAKAAQPAAPT